MDPVTTFSVSGSRPQSSRLAVPNAEGAASVSSPRNMERLTVSSRVWAVRLNLGAEEAASLASPCTMCGNTGPVSSTLCCAPGPRPAPPTWSKYLEGPKKYLLRYLSRADTEAAEGGAVVGDGCEEGGRELVLARHQLGVEQIVEEGLALHTLHQGQALRPTVDILQKTRFVIIETLRLLRYSDCKYKGSLQ